MQQLRRLHSFTGYKANRIADVSHSTAFTLTTLTSTMVTSMMLHCRFACASCPVQSSPVQSRRQSQCRESRRLKKPVTTTEASCGRRAVTRVAKYSASR